MNGVETVIAFGYLQIINYLPTLGAKVIHSSIPISGQFSLPAHIATFIADKGEMNEEKQVLVTFVTKLPQELQVPQTEVVGAAVRLLLLLLLLLLVMTSA